MSEESAMAEEYFDYLDKEISKPEPRTPAQSPLSRLTQLSTTHRLDEMMKNLKNDTYIFDGMALSGQITLFYAKPNTGKTLLFMRLLIDGIKRGSMKSSDVFYLNADDHYKGLLTKAEIAREHGFYMIGLSEAGTKPDNIICTLSELAKTSDASGKVIVLDTLKKFVDLMSKKAQTNLYNILRELTAKNATVIIAGHANKYPDHEGNIIYEGTSDTLSDIDCAYSMYLMSEPTGDVRVQFRREKSRGDVVSSVTYQYSRVAGMSYRSMVDSVAKVDGVNIEQAERELIEQKTLSKYESEKLFVSDLLEDGSKNQSQIIAAFKECGGEGLSAEITLSTLRRSLDDLTGIAWTETRGDHNARFYSLIKKTTASDYLRHKNG